MLYNLLHLPNLVCCHDSSSTSGLFSSWIVFEGTWVPGFQNSVARSVGNTVWMENLFVEALGPFFFLRKSIAPWTRALICVVFWHFVRGGCCLRGLTYPREANVHSNHNYAKLKMWYVEGYHAFQTITFYWESRARSCKSCVVWEILVWPCGSHCNLFSAAHAKERALVISIITILPSKKWFRLCYLVCGHLLNYPHHPHQGPTWQYLPLMHINDQIPFW